MIIEFAGLPASGKTVLSDHVATWFRMARSLRPTRTGAQGAYRGSMSHPRLVLSVVDQLARSQRSWPERWFALRRTLVTAGTLVEGRQTATRERPLVLSEGICQRAFLVFVDATGAAERPVVRRFLEVAPRPDVVIALRVRPTTALRRLRQRGYGELSHRFDGLDDDQLLARFAAGQQLLLDAVSDLRQLSDGAVRTVVLDGDQLEATLGTVEVVLPSLLHARNGVHRASATRHAIREVTT